MSFEPPHVGLKHALASLVVRHSFGEFRLLKKRNLTFDHDHQVRDRLRDVGQFAPGNLRASCALGLIGDGTDVGCGRYHLNEWRAAVRYTWHDKVGFTVSPFSITGSRNFNVFSGNGLPDSNGVMGQVDFTPWGAGKSPLGPRFNARIGVQYTVYGKFNGRRHNFDLAGANAANNNALRVFTWIAF